MMFKLLRNSAVAVITLLALPSCLAADAEFPAETGPAKFLRSDTEALAESKRSGKPVFAFFQEVPG